MNAIRFLRERRMFFRFVLTYLFIFAVTLLVTCVLYASTMSILKKNAVDSALAILEHSRDTMDSHMRTIDNIVNRLVEDYNVQNFLGVQEPLQDSDYEKLRNLKNKLPYTYNNDVFLRHLCVYFPNSDVIVSPSFASGRIELIYDYYLHYEGIEYALWKEMLTSKRFYSLYWPPRSVSVAGEQISAITYIKSIAGSYSYNPIGIVLALIDEKDIAAILDNNLIQSGGQCYILDAEGNRITTIRHVQGQEPDLSGQTLEGTGFYQIDTPDGAMLVAYTSSDFNDWKYVAVMPIDVIMDKANRITRTFWGILIFTFAGASALAIYMANRNSRPIQDMIRALLPITGRELPGAKDEYDFIKGNIAQLIDQNEHLKADMDRKEVLIKNIFFERLLRNRFANDDELTNHMRYARVEFPQGAYLVILARISGYYGQVTTEMLSELDEVRTLIMNVMTRLSAELGFLHPVDEFSFAAVLSVPPDFSVQDFIGRVKQQTNRYNIRIRYGIGLPRGALRDVWESFNEAEKALEQIKEDVMLAVYDEDAAGSSEYYYPIQVETRLISQAKLGEIQGVADLLHAVYRQNFGQRRLTSSQSSLLLNELRATLIKLKDELLQSGNPAREWIEGQLKSFPADGSPDEAFQRAVDILTRLCHEVNERKRSHNVNLRDRILVYIEQDYSNPELCLYSVASRFNLAEKYFSRFFKEQTGENFSAYLERIRMEQAKELLSTGALSVNEVAERVGYHNNNTFYKAFKRIHGVSPRAYRQR